MENYTLEAGEQPGTYTLIGSVTEDDIIVIANQFAKVKLEKGQLVDRPDRVYSYLKTLIQLYEHEVFCALFLNSENRVIAFEELFKGSINSAAVYPREVVKRALELNAAAVVFAHNHPSGNPEPSQADLAITKKLKEALALIEVITLDHVVVGVDGYVSLAERGHL